MSTKSILISVSLGVVIFIIAFFLGGALVIATGIPLVGGLIQVLFLAIIFAIGSKLVPKFGTFTIISVVFTLISTPTIVFGPPGIYKLIIGFLLGIIVDIVVLLLNYKDMGRHIGIALGFILCVPMIWFSLSLFGLQEEAQKLKNLMFIIMIVYAIEGFFGSVIGVNIFKKRLQNLSFIHNLIDDRN